MSENTVDMLIASIHQEVSSSRSIRLALLLRDKVMFIAALCMHLSTPQLLPVKPRELAAVNCARFSFWERIDTMERAAVMLSWCLD